MARHLVAIVAAVLTAAVMVHPAPPTAAQSSGTLAGQLLVASPSMGDPRFARTVVVMARHDKDGAFGIVINRLVRETSLAALLELLGEKEAAAAGSIRLFAGGPVQPELGFVVHGGDYRLPGSIDITGRLALTANREILLDIARGKGPQHALVAFGYSGWGPGQLEGELKRGDWVLAPAEPKLVLEQDRDQVWDAAYALRTQDL